MFFSEKNCLSVCLLDFFWKCRRTRLRSNDLVFLQQRILNSLKCQRVKWNLDQRIKFLHSEEVRKPSDRLSGALSATDALPATEGGVWWQILERGMTGARKIQLMFQCRRNMNAGLFSKSISLFNIQLNPALTDFRGQSIFFCYRQTSVIANKENKRN